MRNRRNKKGVTGRCRALPVGALLFSIMFVASACKDSVTGPRPVASCNPSSFTTFGSDDQEDLVRCLERGVTISGNVVSLTQR
jgi:hypothetical protein